MDGRVNEEVFRRASGRSTSPHRSRTEPARLAQRLRCRVHVRRDLEPRYPAFPANIAGVHPLRACLADMARERRGVLLDRSQRSVRAASISPTP